MKKVIFILIVVTIGTVLFTSCEKDRTTMQKEIAISEDVKGIVVEGAWDIHVIQSDNSSAYIEYSAFIEDRITAEVKNGNLYLKFRNKMGASRKDLVAHINIPDIESIDISGASHASFNGNFQSEKCELKLKGASKVKGFNYTGNYLNIELDGASDCTMSGETKDIKINASGASSLYMFDMLTSNLNINLSGASNAENTINGIVTGKLKGAST